MTQNSLDVAGYLKRPYTRLIVPEDDGSFRAEIKEFPGCIATGDTEEEALASVKDVALSWLEAMVASGQKIPEPSKDVEFSGKLVLRMPKSLHQKAAISAERDGVSLNQFIVSCVAEQIGVRSFVRIPYEVTHFAVLSPTSVSSHGVGQVSWQPAPTANPLMLDVTPYMTIPDLRDPYARS